MAFSSLQPKIRGATISLTQTLDVSARRFPRCSEAPIARNVQRAHSMHHDREVDPGTSKDRPAEPASKRLRKPSCPAGSRPVYRACDFSSGRLARVRLAGNGNAEGLQRHDVQHLHQRDHRHRRHHAQHHLSDHQRHRTIHKSLYRRSFFVTAGMIPGARNDDSSIISGTWYRARGCQWESACGRAPNQDSYRRPDAGRSVRD
jgi:hypothetical protein